MADINVEAFLDATFHQQMQAKTQSKKLSTPSQAHDNGMDDHHDDDNPSDHSVRTVVGGEVSSPIESSSLTKAKHDLCTAELVGNEQSNPTGDPRPLTHVIPPNMNSSIQDGLNVEASVDTTAADTAILNQGLDDIEMEVATHLRTKSRTKEDELAAAAEGVDPTVDSVRRKRRSDDRHDHHRDSRSDDRRHRDRDRREVYDRYKSSRSRDSRSRSGDRDRDRDRARSSRRSDSSRHTRRSRSPSRRSRRRSSRSASRDRDHDRDREASRRRDRSPEASQARKEKSVVESVEDSLERDRRTVFCMQLAARLRTRELSDFFEPCGKVRDVRLVVDKHSGRSKGVAYVEFYEVETIEKAIAMTGQKLLGIPIIVQLTEAERNRVAMQAAAKSAETAFSRLYVGSLHYSLSEQDLAKEFEPFGPLEHVNMHIDKETGNSKGYAFVQFKDAAQARAAAEQMHGHIIMGRPIRVNLITEKSQTAATPVVGPTGTTLSTFNMDDAEMEGFSMNSLSRAELMAKLSRTEPTPAPIVAPVVVPARRSIVVPTMETRCVLLKNMFNPESETEPNWVEEIADDVKEECSKFGKVLHIAVDPESRGHVYLKFDSLLSAQAAVKDLHGRFFSGAQVEALYIADQVYDAQYPDAVGV
ncbi:hypothetical protein BASA50_004522 [Batrachochytrium salamandrivorans]|uniref:RRM domain-containing protein n=1 Tax=Batrachochytrium salamandrivorans TaxID=1357716 RepID=A0ABQ8FFG1_9FUNG|nr:hypothetical protein BASA50_004522 [Batrachochytrium salamandrivorans]